MQGTIERMNEGATHRYEANKDDYIGGDPACKKNNWIMSGKSTRDISRKINIEKKKIYEEKRKDKGSGYIRDDHGIVGIYQWYHIV